MSQSTSIITLTTDFGTKDEYVGVLKGVILRQNRNIVTVDISHHIAPQDVGSATHIVSRSYCYFPEGSVHLVVVDPGVGSSRQIIAMKAYNHFFVGPDNGVFSFLFRDNEAVVHRVDEYKWGGVQTSNTFHGRDIMAPVAAHIATTHSLADIGIQISAASCVKTFGQDVKRLPHVLIGQVVHVDHFGNLCTNISKDDLADYNPYHCQITIGNEVIHAIASSYSAEQPGKYCALFDSHDFLEIAINQGNASEKLGIGTGSEICVKNISAG